MFKQKIDKVLSSLWSLVGLLILTYFFWILNLHVVCVALFCGYLSLVFVFCDDIKTIFPIIFYIPFLISDFKKQSSWFIYFILIAIFVAAVIYFIIRQLVIKKKKVKKGVLFYPLIIADAAFLLGGVIGFLSFKYFIITFGFCLIVYLLYWLAINFTTNLFKFLTFSFVIIGMFLTLQLWTLYFKTGDIAFAMTYRTVVYIGVQNINVCATYFVLSTVCAFFLVYKNKFDFIAILLPLFFLCSTFFCYSRTATLIAFVVYFAGLIFLIINSKQKIQIFVTNVLCVIIALICFIIFKDFFASIINRYVVAGTTLSGRDVLWGWCWDNFISNPAFGVGFTSKIPVPFVSTPSVIMAHNTVLQYLTSVGVVGTIMVGYLYFTKYKLLLTKFNMIKFWTLCEIVVIALSGITDQAPTMDFFVFTMTIIFIAVAEQNDVKDNNLLKFKKLKFQKKSST